MHGQQGQVGHLCIIHSKGLIDISTLGEFDSIRFHRHMQGIKVTFSCTIA